MFCPRSCAMAAGLVLAACAGSAPQPCPSPSPEATATTGGPTWLAIGTECRRSATVALACGGEERILGIACMEDAAACADCPDRVESRAREAIAGWLDRALRREATRASQSQDQRVLLDAVKASLTAVLGDVRLQDRAARGDGAVAALALLPFANVREYFGRMGSEGSPLGLALFQLAGLDLKAAAADIPFVRLPTCPAWAVVPGRRGEAPPDPGARPADPVGAAPPSGVSESPGDDSGAARPGSARPGDATEPEEPLGP